MTHPASDKPALLGGRPVRPQGPPDWPPADDDIWMALQKSFRDRSWGKYHGGLVEALEHRLAEYHGVEFALTCGSGTFAVELALRALKVGPGDEVLLAAYDYPGNFLSVHAVGATPVLVDVAAGNWNLDPEQIAAAVGPRTRVVIASHLHGGLVPMRRIMEVAHSHGLRVIEDAAQAPGALVQGQKAGTWGDVGVLSFGGSKLLTAGRGGAILTRHGDVYQRARLALLRGNLVCPLSELQAAVLLPQFDRLDARNAHRAGHVRRLLADLRDLPGLKPLAALDSEDQPAFYKLGFQLDPQQLGLTQPRFVAALRAEGIAFDEGFKSLHVGRSPTRFRAGGELPEATRAHYGSVVLHHPVLLGTEEDVSEAVRAIRKVIAWAEEIWKV
jgi:perosamine synthetase